MKKVTEIQITARNDRNDYINLHFFGGDNCFEELRKILEKEIYGKEE